MPMLKNTAAPTIIPLKCMDVKLRRNYGTAKSKCYGAQPRNQRGDEREKENLGNLALLVEAVGMVAGAAFGFRIIVLEEAGLLQQHPVQEDKIEGLVDVQNKQAAPEELPKTETLFYAVPDTDNNHGNEDEHTQDDQ